MLDTFWGKSHDNTDGLLAAIRSAFETLTPQELRVGSDCEVENVNTATDAKTTAVPEEAKEMLESELVECESWTRWEEHYVSGDTALSES